MGGAISSLPRLHFSGKNIPSRSHFELPVALRILFRLEFLCPGPGQYLVDMLPLFFVPERSSCEPSTSDLLLYKSIMKEYFRSIGDTWSEECLRDPSWTFP